MTASVPLIRCQHAIVFFHRERLRSPSTFGLEPTSHNGNTLPMNHIIRNKPLNFYLKTVKIKMILSHC